MNKIFFNKNSISNFIVYSDSMYINLVGGEQIHVLRSNNNDFDKLVDKLQEMLRLYETGHHVACFDRSTGKLVID